MEHNMVVAISGASGFIGSYLSAFFEQKGYSIIRLNRTHFEARNAENLKELISQTDVVINLAGASINKRWTKKYKIELHDSRITTTKSLVDAINNSDVKPKVFISTSAVGYYSTRHSYDEYISRKGENFLAELCDEWEKEARNISDNVRLVITRLGVVLASKGGAFRTMTRSSKMGISTIIGPGTQPMCWIDIEDVARAIETIIVDEKYHNIVNLVAPEKITNEEFTRKGAKYYGSYFTIKVPQFVFKLLFGEASLFMCEGQKVRATKLIEGKFKFNTSSIEQFLEKLQEAK